MKPNQLTSLKIGVAVIFLNLYSICHSQPFSSLGAESHGLSSIRFGLQNVWSTFNNPCDMHTDSMLSIGLSAHRLYGISELKSATLSALYTIKHTAVGGYYHYYGYSVSHSSQIGLSTSRNLTARFTLGVGVRLSSFQVIDASRNRQFSVAVSSNHQLQHNKTLYFLIENRLPNNSTATTTNLFAGISFQLNTQVKWLNQLKVNPASRASLQSGIRYQLSNEIVVLSGLNTMPSSLSFGCAIKLPKIKITLDFSTHQVLGFTPTLSSEWPNL